MYLREVRWLVPVPSDVKAVLFDFDHTLIDLGADWEGLRKDIAAMSAKYGVPFEERWVLRGIGMTFRKLSDEGREADAAKFKNEAFKRVVDEENGALPNSKPIDGAVDVVNELMVRGYKIAIVSNNNPDSITRALQMFEFPKIEHVVGRNNGDPVKPSPIPVLKALSRLHVEPKQTVFVGDGEADLAAGKAAGVATVLFSNNGASKEIKTKPAEKIDNLRKLLEMLPSRAK